MDVERSSKRSFNEVDVDANPEELSNDFWEMTHNQQKRKIEVDGSSAEATEKRHELTDAETHAGEPSPQAISSSHGQDEAETGTGTGESSKRPRLTEWHWLDSCDVEHLQGRVLPYETTQDSAMRELSPRDESDRLSTAKVTGLSEYYFDPPRPQDHNAILAQQSQNSPSMIPAQSPTNHNRAPRPNAFAPPASRPSFNQLAIDGQQGIKVLFLIDHATKGDAIHHNISVHIHSGSFEMKLLMNNYRAHRSRLQNHFFKKARVICAQLTSRHEILEIEGKENEDNNKGRQRLEYFSEKCTNGRLTTLYSHLASAVDIPRILAARTPTEKAFKDLITQVFTHTMEDLWRFELEPSKHNLPAKRERENKEEMYRRFKTLTDRQHGLPAARVMPGYLGVPLTAEFRRYVLFNKKVSGRTATRMDVPDSE